MRDNGATVKHDLLALFPRFHVPQVSAWGTVIQCLNVVLTFVTLTVLCLWVIPSVAAIQRMTTEERTQSALRDQAIEQSRERVVRQQAATIAQQERTLKLMEENAKMADDIHRKLSGRNP